MQRSMKSLLVFAAVAGAVIADYGPGAQAQSAASKPGDAMRTLNAAPMDIADANRISSTRGIPHIAGQRPAYLYLTLKEYQSGIRGSTAMSNAVKFLSDDA